MSEERSKGISLRKKRTQRRAPPKEISAPRQISGPMPTGLSATQNSGRPSQESNRSGRRLDAPRERPQRADKTAELVKRRYSQKITQLPSDFGNGAPMPDMPQIPSQYRDAPPSRDGRPPGSSDGRALKINVKALQDPNLRPEQCKCFGTYSYRWLINVAHRCLPTPRRCLRRRYPPLPGRPPQSEEPHLDRPATQCVPEPNTVH